MTTPEAIDAVLTTPRRDRILWTAEAIARRIGSSADFVRDRLSQEPGTPVKKIGGRWCAVESDLLAFFRRSE
jgi:hypothetical protein